MAEGGGGILDGIVGVLSSIFGFFKGLSKAVKQAIFALTLQLVNLGKGTAFVFRQVAHIFKDAGNFFVTAFRQVLPTLLTHIHDWAVLLAKKLASWLGPIVRWIQKKRKWLLDLWKKHVQPVLDAVDIVRRVLRVAGKLHIPGATSIDQKIANVENKITAVFHDVIGKINEVLNWVNRVVTVDGILQEVILFSSLNFYRADVVNFGVNSITRPLTDDEAAAYSIVPQAADVKTHVNDMMAFSNGSESWVRERATQWAADVRALVDAAQ